MPWGNRQELRSPGHGTNAHEDEAFPDTAPCLIRTIPSRSMVLESTIAKCMAKSLSTKVAVEPTIPTIPTIRLPRTAECLGLLWCGKVFRCFYTGHGFVGFLMFLGLTIRNASIIWSLRMMCSDVYCIPLKFWCEDLVPPTIQEELILWILCMWKVLPNWLRCFWNFDEYW